MEFWILRQGKRADDPPVGYFTCYEVHIVRCHLWFPIPEIIVLTLNRFGLSIGQINLTGLQRLLGILVISYEHGVPLNVDHFEALLKPLAVTGGIYRLVPCTNMSIIRETISNGHAWEKCFFFVRLNSASVEENYIPVFRSEWGRYGSAWIYLTFLVPSISNFLVFCFGSAETNPLPPFPDDVIVVRDLLRTGLFSWTSFTPKSGASDFSLPDCNFDDLFKSLPDEFDLPPTVDGQVRSKAFAEGSRMVNAVSNSNFAYLCHIFFRVMFPLAFNLYSDCFHSTRLLRRRGKHELAVVVAGHAAQFKSEFGKLREAQELMGDFRECRGAVGALSRTRVEGYVFQAKMDTMTSYMVSPNKEETMTGVADKGFEFDVHPPECIAEDDVDCAPSIDEESGYLDIFYYEVNDEWITVRLIDFASFLLL
ncbi:hypothetical protein N665_0180s0007 [Sinapis alba]|nr:hypothetical protein N665_0180s0007 [Sinapis alba]